MSNNQAPQSTQVPTSNDQIKEELSEEEFVVNMKPLEEEKVGLIRVEVIRNDGSENSWILLSNLKCVFQKQLPEMPKEYITRLVYDRNHASVIIVRDQHKIVGGITYKLFETRNFAEIVFCAVSSDAQVRGYGSFLMNHFKNHIIRDTKARNFLTYADNYAIGYFKKQGFTKEITLEKNLWVGYIKDYEGGTLMQCKVEPKIDYLKFKDYVGIQIHHLRKRMITKCYERTSYPGLQWPSGAECIPFDKIPGLRDIPDILELIKKPPLDQLQNSMLAVIEELSKDSNSWPFLEPVDTKIVFDYDKFISHPMDLSTLKSNVMDRKYKTFQEFCKDTEHIFQNCRIFNGVDTPYYKAADRLEKVYKRAIRKYKS